MAQPVKHVSSESGRTVATSTAPPPDRKPIPVRIGRILLQGGHINFNDQFIKPNYRANLTGLAGRVGPLDPEKPGEIDIHGAVDKTAPLKISGKVNTFGKRTLSRYYGDSERYRYAGFQPLFGQICWLSIEKGKLSVDVHYHVEKGELTAENNVFLDQLTFGEKVESPDALRSR